MLKIYPSTFYHQFTSEEHFRSAVLEIEFEVISPRQAVWFLRVATNALFIRPESTSRDAIINLPGGRRPSSSHAISYGTDSQYWNKHLQLGALIPPDGDRNATTDPQSR